VGEVKTIAVIGAGTLGREIAQAAAAGGYRTIVEDLVPGALRHAEQQARLSFARAVESGALSGGEAARALGRLEYADRPEEAAREADFVIEAVPDDLESKLEIFTLLDKVCRPGTILVSNTVGFSISEIAAITYRPAHVLAMRFPLPMAEGRLIQVVRGRATDEATVAQAVEVGGRMGKQVRVFRDALADSPLPGAS
jgi:3-hydroxybutyryl-CoA dehydrogenase